MKASIQIKMFLLMLGIGVIFSTGIVLFRLSENDKIKGLLNDQKKEQAKLLNASFSMTGKSLEAITRDYSLWDEMVHFMKAPDKKWAEENIDPGLSTFDANYIWIFSNDLSLVYSKRRNMPASEAGPPVKNPKFTELISREKFSHFFLPVSNGLMEVFGAPVQPSRDTLRQLPPSGYFFTGRLLSKSYLNKLDLLTSSKTSLLPGTPLYEACNDSTIMNHIELYTWDRKPAGTIRSERTFSMISKVEASANVQFISIIIFIALVMVFSSVFLLVTVSNPLRQIARSLQLENPDFISRLQAKKDEFGKLSSLIIKFFRQKEELIDEIAERSRIEEELRKIKNNLEDMITDRTLDLADANERLKDEIVKIRKVKEELSAAKEKAEESDRLKTEFLAQMSHEIRTPINTILNYISLIKEEVEKPLSEDMQFSFSAIDSSSRRMIRTIDMILNMSEIQTGRFECNYQEIDLGKDVIRNIKNEFSSMADVKNLKLNIRNAAENAVIKGDLYTINQILVNLLHNAIKYTNSGEISLSIYRPEAEKICIDVSDTGIGMSEDYQKKLFMPFSQEEQGYRRKFEGNGLGLALVKKYCEFNNAEILVKSTKGVGSTFTVVFNEEESVEKEPESSVA
ncbi:MAG TPA: ATP-binding protein [Ignavibacteriales bacterium]|nr:ATP-binding protein [Ignavibacteriales bacterium]